MLELLRGATSGPRVRGRSLNITRHLSCILTTTFLNSELPDSQGRPVMIVLAARHDMSARNLEETNRLIVYVLDNAAAAATDKHLNPLGRFLCLFDLSGALVLMRAADGLPSLGSCRMRGSKYANSACGCTLNLLKPLLCRTAHEQPGCEGAAWHF